MAESDTILQLGIEAAREGNREEARNLFGLLTRQEPNNVQAWLWLAGVADGPDQRRAALERVVELDPTNEMAVKGLQAMGVAPTTRIDERAAAPSSPPPQPEAPARQMTDEERYAAELDSAFDDDYAAIPRAETAPRSVVDDETLAGGATTGTPSRGTARERSAARRGATPIRSGDDDDLLVPARSGPSPLLLALAGLIVLLLLFLGYQFLFNRGPGEAPGGEATSVAVNPTDEAATAAAIVGGTPAPDETVGLPVGGGVLTPTTETGGTAPLTPTTAITPTAVPAQPTAAPAVAANPNLQPVAIGDRVEANGWSFTYPDPSYVLVLGNQVGNFTAQGTYVHVLIWVTNNTGTTQPLPPDFFALKDSDNNVYRAAPQVASAAVQRGVNADLGMEDPIDAGAGVSLYLVFDVKPGAPNLTLFSTAKNDQGWPLNVVP